MKINCIATGSSGNLYELVDSDGNSIVLEAGMPRATYIKNRVGKSPPEMCLISHGHMDHAKHKGEFAALMPTHYKQRENVSENWKALGFEVKHGESFTTVFIIKSLVEEKFLFFGTDFEFSENHIELYDYLKSLNVENYLIECNYNDYLFHLADQIQRDGCSRHMGDNDVVNFMRIVKPKNPKIILIHGSNRLSADTYTKKYIGGKLLNATVEVATGVKNGVKNIFLI
jgi:Cft2 family RNA processing exonuclease